MVYRKFKLLLVFGLLLLVLSGCLKVHDSPAPGCVSYIGLAPMGGCWGKNVIQDIHLEPAETCLTITANNCNGGVLEVDSLCQEPVTLGGTPIEADQHISLDVRHEGKGYHLVRSSGNISTYLPKSDEHIVIEGSIGNTPLHLEFVKTGPLCSDN